MSNNIESRLWDYIDGISDTAECSAIERLLRDNAEWKAKYSELLLTHEAIMSSELETPSLRFTKNVMEEIGKLHVTPAASKYINKRVIWGISILFFIVTIIFVVYGLLQVDWNSSSSSSTNINVSEKLDKIDFGRFFNNTWVNVLLMINVILGFALLDNYLNNKRKTFGNKLNVKSKM